MARSSCAVNAVHHRSALVGGTGAWTGVVVPETAGGDAADVVVVVIVVIETCP